MAEALAVGDVVAKNYRVVKQLGAGGFGTVFLADNLTLAEQKVVIKVLNDSTQGAGAEEARVLATLDHPNVVHVYAYDERYDCIVMQYLSGTSLIGLIGTLHPVSAVRVAHLVALALSAVHQKGLVHRDVKPDNVMVELRGREVGWVKLIDFGIALKTGKIPPEAMGSPEYCGPEQFSRTVKAHPANDVYALGVTLFELCALARPFDSGDVNKLAQMQVYDPVPDLLETRKRRTAGADANGVQIAPEVLEPRVEMLLDRVDQLVREMMSKDPTKRPDTLVVARRLDEIEREFASETTQVSMIAPIQLTPRMKTTTRVLPKAEPSASPSPNASISTGSLIAGVEQPKRRQRTAVAVVLLLLLALIGFAVFGSGTEAPVVATVVDAGAPMVVEAPVPDAAPVAVAEPPGEDLTGLPHIATPTTSRVVEPAVRKTGVQVQAPASCVFDDRFRDYARRTRADLRTMGKPDAPEFVSVDDRFADAMIEKDCRRTNAALNDMRRLVGAPLE